MKLNPLVQPTSVFGSKLLTSLVILLLLAVVGVATWQLGQVNPPAPYCAPSLNVHLTGAAVGNFDFSVDEFLVREVDPTGFVFATNENAPLRFRLEFSGAQEAIRGSSYILSADYPLTMTLFEGEELSAVFTATEGTVEFGSEGGRVAAYLSDESGRDLFLGANFAYSEDEACSESYRFCFESSEAVRGR